MESPGKEQPYIGVQNLRQFGVSRTPLVFQFTLLEFVMQRFPSAVEFSSARRFRGPRLKWVAGDKPKPHLAQKVLVVYDQEYYYSAAVPPTFDHDNLRVLRYLMRCCFEDRLFTRDCDVPCVLQIYEGGVPIHTRHFLIYRRTTSRYPRNDFSFRVSHQEWRRALMAPVPERRSFLSRIISTMY
jgi:hypothetical protein